MTNMNLELQEGTDRKDSRPIHWHYIGLNVIGVVKLIRWLEHFRQEAAF